jgi:hypothetical protein
METLRAIEAALNMEVTALLPVNELVPEADFAKMQAQVQKETAQLEKELNVLPRMCNGTELLSVVSSVQALNTDHPHPSSQEEAAAIADLIAFARSSASRCAAGPATGRYARREGQESRWLPGRPPSGQLPRPAK